jgi:hypothetical protein
VYSEDLENQGKELERVGVPALFADVQVIYDRAQWKKVKTPGFEID